MSIGRLSLYYTVLVREILGGGQEILGRPLHSEKPLVYYIVKSPPWAFHLGGIFFSQKMGAISLPPSPL